MAAWATACAGVQWAFRTGSGAPQRWWASARRRWGPAGRLWSSSALPRGSTAAPTPNTPAARPGRRPRRRVITARGARAPSTQTARGSGTAPSAASSARTSASACPPPTAGRTRRGDASSSAPRGGGDSTANRKRTQMWRTPPAWAAATRGAASGICTGGSASTRCAPPRRHAQRRGTWRRRGVPPVRLARALLPWPSPLLGMLRVVITHTNAVPLHVCPAVPALPVQCTLSAKSLANGVQERVQILTACAVGCMLDTSAQLGETLPDPESDLWPLHR
mmetsp:Transcript_10381/g.30797  ORF Transcript_10381/g.30797 Transcript_10381/m.30797 type:complete len:278 (+) Transcript_10381:772-1605(+)